MSEEEQLKLQCYLDGELTEKDRRDLALWLDENEEARTALDVLQTVRETIRENEPACASTWPSSRERLQVSLWSYFLLSH
jgi:negative regulator of sigma E activity